MLTLNDLSEFLPEGSLGTDGTLSFAVLSEKEFEPESSCIEPIVRFLDKLADFTNHVNDLRRQDNPSKSPIIFVSKDLVGTSDAPELEFTIRVAIDTKQFVNNLIDPTDA